VQAELVTKADAAALATVSTTGQYSALLEIPSTFAPAAHDQAWSTILGTPTTLAGYGIADAASAAQGALAATAVQPAAISSFETSAQLNTRDTANRARANHTGTQAASSISDFAATAAAAAPVQSVAGRNGAVTLAKGDVGLGAVDNTADADKPISAAAQTALNLKANTSALAAVATTGQYSALLGIPSTFAPAAHNQAASTITGLATVATSGVYADLSAKPAIPFGFTYDQTAEPVGPAAGATWRERSANGRILRDWEWDAARSLWVSELIFSETTRLPPLSLPTSTHGILLETASLLTYFSAAFTPTVANDVTIQGRVAGEPGGFTIAVFLSPFTLSSTGLSFAQWETYFRTFPVNVLISANRLGLYVNGNPAIQQIFNLVVFNITITGSVPTRNHQVSATYRYYR
jgi:hypothetical protein